MIIRNITAIVATACVGVWLQGCGAAPASQSEDELALPAGGDLDESAAAIRGGNEPAGGSGAVIVGSRCTGVLIGTGMVLTAAHCFETQLGSSSSGWITDAVSYVANGNVYRCITNPTPNQGRCTRVTPMYVARASASSVDWPAKDVAIMFMGVSGEKFFHVTSADAADGIYTGPISAGAKYIFHGQGHNTNSGVSSNVMRYMRGSLSTVFPQSFAATVSNVATCAGDSGGPYMFDGDQWVFGLLFGGGPVSPGGNNCTQPGGSVVGPRLNLQMFQWIALGRYFLNQPACANPSASSPNHWVCP